MFDFLKPKPSEPVPGFSTFSAPSTSKDGPKTYLLDFATTSLPEYAPYFAVVIDDLFTPQECDELLEFASGGDESKWEEALVNSGGGRQVSARDYRRGSRIMVDDKDKAQWIYERVKPCLDKWVGELEVGEFGGKGKDKGEKKEQGKPVEVNGEKKFDEYIVVGGTSRFGVKRQGKWRMERLNERLRFLKYVEGDFFLSRYSALPNSN
jgi:hypothetical protein